MYKHTQIETNNVFYLTMDNTISKQYQIKAYVIVVYLFLTYGPDRYLSTITAILLGIVVGMNVYVLRRSKRLVSFLFLHLEDRGNLYQPFYLIMTSLRILSLALLIWALYSIINRIRVVSRA